MGAVEGRTTDLRIAKRVKDGAFPAPLKLGPGSTGWRVADIDAFLASPSNVWGMDARSRRRLPRLSAQKERRSAETNRP
nr:AlpA family phage regulatory protein [Paraburkholderia caballeronis]